MQLFDAKSRPCSVGSAAIMCYDSIVIFGDIIMCLFCNIMVNFEVPSRVTQEIQ